MSNAAPIGVSPRENPTYNANTTNTSTTTNTTGDIGFTGAQGVEAFQAAANVFTTLATQQGQSLGALVGASAAAAQSGFNLVQDINSRSLDTVNTTSFRVEETLSNLINATRDFTQRSVNASTNQATPLTDIPAASSTVLPSDFGLSPTVIIIGIVIIGGVLLLNNSKGK